MIEKEDIKEGLRFYVTREACLTCGFDPMCEGPVLFSIDRDNGYGWKCTSVNTKCKFTACFGTEDIMEFGKKHDTATEDEDKSKEEKI